MFSITLSTWKQKLFRVALRRFGGHVSVLVATLMGPQNSMWPIDQIKHLPFFRLDESLWQSLDLAGKNLHPDVTVRLLSRGVIAFRCPRSFMEQPLGESFR